MKLFKKIALVVIILIPICGSGGYMYLRNSLPTYSGELTLQGLNEEVEVLFDTYAIPHIYAQNEADAYFALGYVHAQERLFQMELIRRAASGRLAEILGPDLVEVDQLFRTVGLDQAAKESANCFLIEGKTPFRQAALAYIDGVNQFIETGPTPPEFELIGIPKTLFTPENVYHISGYMAFGFAMGFDEDPAVDRIMRNWGPDYLVDVVDNYKGGTQTIKSFPLPILQHAPQLSDLRSRIRPILDKLPIPLLIGSNSWIVGPQKTKSGHAILENDTHIGYSQPAVWYEAHLEYPGFSFYGLHLAGLPLGVIGHTRSHAWGITMLENDDMDFFIEKKHPDRHEVWEDGQWVPLKVREEVIRVKDAPDQSFQVFTSRHGPLVQQVFEGMVDTMPIAMSWAYNQFLNKSLHAVYKLAHARDINDARSAVSSIDAPGLNMMYADTAGNIAWWAAGRYTRYPDHVNTKTLLDGSTAEDAPLGKYPFEENPQAENPPWGYVYSANNQPDSVHGQIFPGYYAPEGRPRRIVEMLEAKSDWTVEEVKKMSVDTRSTSQLDIVSLMIDGLSKDKERSTVEQKALEQLKSWDGQHLLSSIGPVIYQRWTYHIMAMAMIDEMGEPDFQAISGGFLLKRTTPRLMSNEASRWWDDITTEAKETREDIFEKAFSHAISQLQTQLGNDVSQWQWGKVHTVEHQHAIGRQGGALAASFNIGPFPTMGGSEAINCIAVKTSASGTYESTYGPAMRNVVDLGNLETGWAILPTGQSGHFLSDHYDDQAEMYVKGEYRKMMMNRGDIEADKIGRLVLKGK